MTDPQVRANAPISRPSLAKRVRLPRLSGKASAAWLVVCFGLTGVLIPMVLRLSPWIKFEIVLAIWWAVWLAVLTSLLFAGQRVSDDHQLGEPRNWLSFFKRPQAGTSSDWWDGFFWGSLFVDGEACLMGVAIIVGFIVLLGVIWFLIEVAIPVLAFLLHFVTRGMLAQVVNDRHHCRGRLGRALAWGFLWASVYTSPLAGVVWFIHYVHGAQGGT
jgi:hypothetical protein